MLINDVNIISKNFEFEEGEAQNYYDYIIEREKIKDKDILNGDIIVTLNDDNTVDIDWKFVGRKFERIRRITGYLVGSLDSWNDSKRSEERERVKHDTEFSYE